MARRRPVGFNRGDALILGLVVVLAAPAAGLLWMSERMVAPTRPRISDSERAVLGLIVRRAPLGGALVTTALSPALEAGLRAGDRLIGVDGHPVDRPEDLARIVASAGPGVPVRVEARRLDPERGEGGVLVDVVPDRRPLSPADYGLPFEEVSFRNPGGLLLRGWFIPAPRGAGPWSAPAVAFGHGNATDRREWLDAAQAIHRAGLAQLLFDFAGRGDSEGDVVTLGLREAGDLRAALDYLAGRQDVDPSRLGLAGRSMGAAAAILEAAEDPRVRALVADSAFADLPRLVDETLSSVGIPASPVRPLLFRIAGWRAGYDPSTVQPVRRVAQVPAPILLVHGDADVVVSRSHADALKAAATGSCTLVVVPGLGHNDPRPAEVVDRMVTFLARVL